MVETELAAGSHQIYTIGPLIHNPQVLERFENQGVKILEAETLPDDLRGTVVVIRAHGIAPDVEAALLSRGCRLADATCPKVKASQLKARSLSEKGYQIFLAGEKQHGELIGIQGYAPGCFVVANSAEAEYVAAKFCCEAAEGKAALLGQTTISQDEYQLIAVGIQKYFPDLKIVDTICSATAERQHALKKLCNEVDAVVVAGGKDSANTRRLLAIAQAQGKKAWLVESAAEIPGEIAACSVVGISAGASTPDTTINAIEVALLQ
jgi:4-hydroxy-3-methylbut-2-enyl diphosphate reductase